MIVFVVLCTGAIATSWYVQESVNEKLFQTFRGETTQAASVMQNRLNSYVDAMYGLNGLFAASKSVEGDEWQSYIARIELPKRFPGIRSIRYNERVTRQNKEIFLKSLSEDVRIKQFPGPFRVYPESEKEEYILTKYVEPFEKFHDVIGRDVSAFPSQLEPIQRARRTGELTATEVDPVPSDPGGNDFRLIAPVYRNNSNTGTEEERFKNFTGVITATFRVRELFSVLLKESPVPAGVRFRVYDTTRPNEPYAKVPIYETAHDRIFSKFLRWTQTVKVGDRTWSVHFYAVKGYFIDPMQRYYPIFILVGGTLVSLLVAGTLLAFATSRARAFGLAGEMTVDLRRQTALADEARRAAETAQAKMRESGERHRLIVETALDAVVTTDENGVITGWNHQAESMLGWKSDEVMGRRVSETILPAHMRSSRTQGFAGFFKMGEGGAVKNRIETVVLHKEGFEFPVELAVWPVRIAGALTFSAFIRDITERVASEKTIKDIQLRQRAILDNIPDIAWLKDKECRFIAVNQPLADSAGTTMELFVGKTDFDFWPKELAEGYRADDEAVMRTKQRKMVEERFVDKNGVKKYIETVKTPVVNDRGEVVGTAGIARDITERKLAEEMIRAERDNSAAIINGTPAIVCGITPEGKTTFLNLTGERVTGYAAAEIVGKDWWQTFYPGDLYEQVDKFYKDFGKGDMRNYRMVLINRRGEKRAVTWNSIVRHDSAGKLVEIIGFGNDVTDMEKSAEQLKSTQLQLFQMAKLESVGRLAAGVAHEVKNPLAVIQMGVDYLAAMKLDGEAEPVLKDIGSAVKRADTVIRGLLDFSSNSQIEAQLLDLNLIIEESLSLVRHETIKNHVNIVKEFSGAAPKIMIDRNKIEQVLINLCVNAVHAMPLGGTLTLRTFVAIPKHVSKAGGTDPYVVCEIDDTGTGIPPEKISKVFDPFFTTKPTGKGTGLGLTVTQKIMELHNGTIGIENRTQGGARVTLCFPINNNKEMNTPK